jgi:hypothetical protein
MHAIIRKSLTSIVLLLAACEPGGPIAEHRSIDRTRNPLREAFNADYGKVRVLMLVSPT